MNKRLLLLLLQRHLALIYCPDQPIRQRGETKTDKQRTKFEYSAGFAVNTKAWIIFAKKLSKGKRCGEIDREANH